MPTLIMSASAMLAPAVHRHCSFIDSREVNNFLSSYGNDNTKDKECTAIILLVMLFVLVHEMLNWTFVVSSVAFADMNFRFSSWI